MGPDTASRPASRRRRAQAARATELLIAALLCCAGCREPTRLVSGTVESRRVTVAAETLARVVAVHAREGTAVRAGDLVVELDAELARARESSARAALGAAQAELSLLEAGSRPQEIAEAEAELAVREQALAVARLGARREELDQLEASLEQISASMRLAQLSLGREQQLLGSGHTAQASVDEASARLEELSAQHKRLQAELAEAKSGARAEDLRAREAELARAQARLSLVREGPRAEEIAAARARLEASEAELVAAGVELARCRVVAPLDGSVEVVDVEPGELAQPGQPLFAIARAGILRVRTFLPQERIGELQPGDTLRLTVDGRPDAAIEARVERIWDEAEFTAGNVQTPEDRMLLVFRVDLEVASEAAAGLRPGASVLVDLDSRARP